MLMENFALMAHKIGLGMTLAAPIGPVTIEMIKRGLRHGFLAAFSVRLGGALGNLLCLIAAYYGLSHLLSYPQLLNALGVIGSGLLIYMGVQTLRKGIEDLDLDGDIALQSGVRWGFYLAIANPVAFVFWPGVFAATLDPSAGMTSLGLFQNLLIIVGVLLWGGALSAGLAYGHTYLSKKAIVRISQLSALCLFYFGLKNLWVIIERL